jgi:tetratricopeptide (TPR) repeat protein
MSKLTSAVKAELASDYRKALSLYRQLIAQGSQLDRIGISQALARCHEKLGSLKEATYWHERAGQAYMRLPSKVMGTQERAYYALVEFRSALQEYMAGPAMKRAGQRSVKALDTCLKGGKEGYSHEMLIAGYLSAKLGMLKKSATFFTDSAKQFEREAKLKLAREMYEMPAFSFDKAGDHKTATTVRRTAGKLRL